MDIMLERILTLIPRKPDGKFVHGALKEFANTVGLKSGNLVSDWINGRSTSYKSYVYEISAKYNVSVEWLKGETDKKEKSPTPEGVGLPFETVLSLLDKLSDDELIDVLAKCTEAMRKKGER